MRPVPILLALCLALLAAYTVVPGSMEWALGQAFYALYGGLAPHQQLGLLLDQRELAGAARAGTYATTRTPQPPQYLHRHVFPDYWLTHAPRSD